MKKTLLCLIFISGLLTTHAQNLISSLSQPDSLANKSLFELLSGIEKKTNRFNLYLNLHSNFSVNFRGDSLTDAAFKMQQLRIEAKGQINDWLSYRWRQRLNRGNTPEALDNLPLSIDYAMITIKLTDRFSTMIGKQNAAYGGFEYDLNPIEIYQYSDMLDNMYFDFMTGLTFVYQILPQHELQLQIVNSRCSSLEDLYGTLPQGTEKSKASFAYTLNWNGKFFQNMLKTRWSFSVLNQARKKLNYFYALGNELNLGRFNMYLDFYLSDEELDSRGLISEIIRTPEDNTCAQNARYQSWVTKLNYRVAPKWNIFLKGMYETSSVYKQTEALQKGKYRTSLGYFSGIEFYPMTENFHFYLAYLGRSYNFTDKAKNLGASDYSTSKLSLGFIYQLPMF